MAFFRCLCIIASFCFHSQLSLHSCRNFLIDDRCEMCLSFQVKNRAHYMSLSSEWYLRGYIPHKHTSHIFYYYIYNAIISSVFTFPQRFKSDISHLSHQLFQRQNTNRIKPKRFSSFYPFFLLIVDVRSAVCTQFSYVKYFRFQLIFIQFSNLYIRNRRCEF